MAAIDNIVDKLIIKANEEKEEILKKANDEASQIKEDTLARAIFEKDKIWAEAKNDADRIYSSITQHTIIRSRDAENIEKEKIIDEIFSRAKEKLKNLDDKKYEEILKKELAKYEGPYILYLPKDRKINSSFLDELKRKIANIVIVNDEDVESGFIIEKGKIRYNYDFSEVIDFRKNELEPEVVKILKLDQE